MFAPGRAPVGGDDEEATGDEPNCPVGIHEVVRATCRVGCPSGALVVGPPDVHPARAPCDRPASPGHVLGDHERSGDRRHVGAGDGPDPVALPIGEQRPWTGGGSVVVAVRTARGVESHAVRGNARRHAGWPIRPRESTYQLAVSRAVVPWGSRSNPCQARSRRWWRRPAKARPWAARAFPGHPCRPTDHGPPRCRAGGGVVPVAAVLSGDRKCVAPGVNLSA